MEATLRELAPGPEDAAEVLLARELAKQVDAAKAGGGDPERVLQQVRLAAGRLDKVLSGLRVRSAERAREAARAEAAAEAEEARRRAAEPSEAFEVLGELQDRARRRRGEQVAANDSPTRAAARKMMEADFERMVAERH
ncbi:hypothetical protein ABL57_09145 [Kocuria sp. SM24M-10]|nr:hypothetical protein ABL57_09145 [Kocuria sp. SM24M-10]